MHKWWNSELIETRERETRQFLCVWFFNQTKQTFTQSLAQNLNKEEVTQYYLNRSLSFRVLVYTNIHAEKINIIA